MATTSFRPISLIKRVQTNSSLSVVLASRQRRTLTTCHRRMAASAIQSGQAHSLTMAKNRLLVSSLVNSGNFQRKYNDNESPLRFYSNSRICRMNDYPPHTLFPMPALSPTMESGTIQAWHKSIGDSFIAGDVLCTIDTDKASVDFEAQDDGVLAQILIPAGGDDIRIGVPICVVVEDADQVNAFKDYTSSVVNAPSDSSSASSTAPETPTVIETAITTTTATMDPSALPMKKGEPSILMPSARHLAQSKGLDATVLAGSGKGGRVTKADVLHALDHGLLTTPWTAVQSSAIPLPPEGQIQVTTVITAASTASSDSASLPKAITATVAAAASPDLPLPVIETSGAYTDTPNSKMRKIIASRLTQSKREVPHFYTSQQVELDQIAKLRKKLVSQYDVKVSVNDFVLRCCALALRDVPEVNSSFNVQNQEIQILSSIDISVAVATPTGLITPIVTGADKLGLSAISEVVKDLATRARLGKLAPHEYQGGSFSVSNLGMFGINEFSAVINPPQAAILAVGGGSRRIIPAPFDLGGAPVNSQPRVCTVMTARLSADRRVIDEPTASLFLSAFAHYANEPDLLLL